MRLLNREILTAVDASGLTNTSKPPAYYYSTLRIELGGSVLSAGRRTTATEITSAAGAEWLVHDLERELLYQILTAAERKLSPCEVIEIQK